MCSSSVLSSSTWQKFIPDCYGRNLLPLSSSSVVLSGMSPRPTLPPMLCFVLNSICSWEVVFLSVCCMCSSSWMRATWEFVWKAGSWAPFQTDWIGHSGWSPASGVLTSLPDDSDAGQSVRITALVGIGEEKDLLTRRLWSTYGNRRPGSNKSLRCPRTDW